MSSFHGYHHITNTVTGGRSDVAFHVGLLPLRNVKRTVLLDGDRPFYHLYYGNQYGDPGTLVTSFAFGPDRPLGRQGSGQVSSIALKVPAGSLGFWADRQIFQAAVAIIFGEIGDLVPEDFKKDRAAMSGSFSSEALKAAVPLMRDQYRAHTQFVEDQLSDGRRFWGGEQPGLADIHAFMNPWFVASALPHKAKETIAEFPNVQAWYERVTAIGHGTKSDMTPKEALAVAKAATSEAREAADPRDANGRKPGDKVTVSADDYGRDPIAGTIVFSNAREIAIRRSAPEVGEVVVHFPRAGFVVQPA